MPLLNPGASYADCSRVQTSKVAQVEVQAMRRSSARSGIHAERNLKRTSVATAGTSILEFALVAPMVLLLVFAVFDFARLFYVEMNLQNAVREAARFGITGNHLSDPKHPGQTLSRVNSIIQVAQQAAIGLDVSTLQVSSLGGGKGSAGGPGDTLTLSLTFNLQLMTPIVAQFFTNGAYTFTVGVSLKNEPFPPADTS